MNDTRIQKKLSSWLGAIAPRYFSRHLHNPVFVIGYGKSGKSLLTRLLSHHRDVAHWPEANNIWDPTGYPWHRSSRETPPVWVDPEHLTQRWWGDTQPRVPEIRATFGAYQWLSRRPWFVNDTPMNTFRIPYLLSIFPDARLIHMIRDGRDAVYESSKHQHQKIQAHPEPYRQIGFGGTFEELLKRQALFWSESMEEVALQNERFGLVEKRILLEVTYEELCSGRDLVLERVTRHLGLDPLRYSPDVWRYELARSESVWESELSFTLVAELQMGMASWLAKRGYA